MSREQRKLFAGGLIELANIIAGALVFGQFVSGLPFQTTTFSLGIIFATTFYLGAYIFSRETGRQ